MNDTTFTAALKGAKLIARKDPDRPGTTLRRVAFSLVREFCVEQAEWLGESAIELRKQLQGRALNRFELPINGYHGKATFIGMAGNVETEVDGVVAVAAVVGREESEIEEITFTFESFPEAKLLTFLASSVKEHIGCELVRSQLEIDDRLEAVADASTGGDGKRTARTTIAGTGEPKNGARTKGARAS